jgi:hypothetical protein
MYSWILYYFRGAKKIIIENFPLKFFVKENEASIGNISCAKLFPNQLITWRILTEPAICIHYILWSSLFMGGGEANS